MILGDGKVNSNGNEIDNNKEWNNHNYSFGRKIKALKEKITQDEFDKEIY